MGYNSVVVSVLALSAFAAAVPSIRDNSLDGGERVVLVSPVLAPPRDSRTHDTTHSRQYPTLVLLAQTNPQYARQEPEARELRGNPQPIYVQKLEDQEQPGLNREKRHLKYRLGRRRYNNQGGSATATATATAFANSGGYGKKR